MSLSFDITLQRGTFALSVAGKVEPGITSVYGPSGCGKTTLLRSIAGLEPDVTGTMSFGPTRWLGRGSALPAHKRRVAMVFQDGRLFAHLDVAGNLRYAARRAAEPVDWDRVVDRLDLGPLLGRRVAGLSGGERQRVALGRALLSTPSLLLLDEPLSALDPRRRDDIMPYLEDLRDTTTIPILHVSHDLSEVVRLADRLWLMADGQIARVGPLNDVLSDPASTRLLGPRQAGAAVSGQVRAYDPQDDLTEVGLGAGAIFLPGRIGAPGATLRLRIPAHDVLLSRDRPEGMSALSILPVSVTGVHIGDGPGVLVGLKSGEARLVARITRRSAREMGLQEGTSLYAVLKATAIARQDAG